MKHFNTIFKLCAVVLAFPSMLNLIAFAEITDSTSLHYYEKGKTAYIFDEGAKFIDVPNTNRSALKTLPTDTAVTLQEDSSAYDEANSHIENGIELPYLKVRLADGTEGYVWAGSLAKTTLSADLDLDDSQERIMTNFTAITESTDGRRDLTTTVKVLRDGKVINNYAFNVPYDEVNGFDSTLYQIAGFSPMVALLKQEFQPQACGVLGGAVILAWDGSHWVKALDEEYVSDAGAFSNDVEFIFPLERGGKINTIKALRTVLSDFDDRTNKYKKTERALKTYEWQNGTFKTGRTINLKGKKWP